MEIEKKHCGLVLLVSLIGCIQLQASDATTRFSASVEGQTKAGDTVVDAAAAVVAALSSLTDSQEQPKKRQDTPTPSRTSSLRISGNASRVASTPELPEVVEESTTEIVPGLSALAVGVNDLAQEYLQEEGALTSLEVQLVAANLMLEQLKVEINSLKDLLVTLEAKDTFNDDRLNRLEEKLIALEAAQKSQSALLNGTQQSRQVAPRSRRGGFMSFFGFCMRSPENDPVQGEVSSGNSQRMVSANSLPQLTSTTEAAIVKTLQRTASGRSMSSQESVV